MTPVDLRSLTVLSYDDLQKLGIRYSAEHLRRLERAGLFPKRRELSPKRICWRLLDIEAWLASRPVGLD